MITKKLIYIPKGSMCKSCKHVYRDCSYLKFDEMLRISKGDSDDVVIVRCNDFINFTENKK